MRWTALAMSVWLTGCSFAFVSGPPEHHEQLPYFSCTESRVVPVLDTVFTGLETANAILATASSDTDWHDLFCSKGDSACSPALSRGAAIPIYIGLALVGAAGMYYGYTRTSQCRAARAAWALRSQGQPGVMPQPGTWPPPPAAGAPGATPAPAPGATPQPGTWPPPAPGAPGTAPAPAPAPGATPAPAPGATPAPAPYVPATPAPSTP